MTYVHGDIRQLMPAREEKYDFRVTTHLYNGVSVNVHIDEMTATGTTAEEAKEKVRQQVIEKYKRRSDVSLSSIHIESLLRAKHDDITAAVSRDLLEELQVEVKSMRIREQEGIKVQVEYNRQIELLKAALRESEERNYNFDSIINDLLKVNNAMRRALEQIAEATEDSFTAEAARHLLSRYPKEGEEPVEPNRKD